MWNRLIWWSIEKLRETSAESATAAVNFGFDHKEPPSSLGNPRTGQRTITAVVNTGMTINGETSRSTHNGRCENLGHVDKTDNKSVDSVEVKLKRRKSDSDFRESVVKNVEYLQPEDFLYLGRACYSTPSSVIEGTESRRRLRLAEVGSSNSSLNPVNFDPSGDGWKLQLDDFSSKKRGKSDDKKCLPKSLRKYYKAQDKLIDTYEGIELDLDDVLNTISDKKSERRVVILARVTFFCNLMLLVVKLTAAILSGSMAIISSLVDSVVDLASGVTIWATAKYARKRDPYVYPQGRTKLEPIGIVILAVIMSVASFVLIIESVEKIVGYVNDPHSDAPEMGPAAISIAAVTIVVKLVLFLFCRGNMHPAIKVLALDHRNDVVANSVALICGYLGSVDFQNYTGRWQVVFVDPIGAILISIYIVYNWIVVLKVQIKVLTGYTAKPDFLSKITWVCVNHHRKIQYVDTVRAFHFGNNFLVEVDIVLPEKMTVKEAHDIGELLQQKIESFPEVERAFVHIDYDYDHHPGEEHKIV